MLTKGKNTYLKIKSYNKNQIKRMDIFYVIENFDIIKKNEAFVHGNSCNAIKSLQLKVC